MPQKHACLYQTRFATDKIPPVSTQEDQEWIKNNNNEIYIRSGSIESKKRN